MLVTVDHHRGSKNISRAAEYRSDAGGLAHGTLDTSARFRRTMFDAPAWSRP